VPATTDYDTIAERYAANIDDRPWNALYERPATLALLPEVDRLDVLDAGCGHGWYADWLLRHGARVERSLSPLWPSRRYRSIHFRAVRGQTPTACAAAFSVCPLCTSLTMCSRPRGASRAFSWMFIRFLSRVAKASTPSASLTGTGWTTY
jgi:hypothetical protein